MTKTQLMNLQVCASTCNAFKLVIYASITLAASRSHVVSLSFFLSFIHPGAVHPRHPGSEAGSLHHRGGPHLHPQPQTASAGPPHKVTFILKDYFY